MALANVTITLNPNPASVSRASQFIVDGGIEYPANTPAKNPKSRMFEAEPINRRAGKRFFARDRSRSMGMGILQGGFGSLYRLLGQNADFVKILLLERHKTAMISGNVLET
jgi:hypothetical protein